MKVHNHMRFPSRGCDSPFGTIVFGVCSGFKIRKLVGMIHKRTSGSKIMITPGDLGDGNMNLIDYGCRVPMLD